jgi:uncharacterized membrane protein
MKSLILAACIFVCTVGIANAQREGGNYMGGYFGSGGLPSYGTRIPCPKGWSAASNRCIPHAQPIKQAIKKK